MKFEYNWPTGLLCFNILMGLEAERSKVNLDLWNLFKATDSFNLTYQVRIKTLASSVLKKINFSIVFQFKGIWKQN